MKVKELIKTLCSINPNADILISNFTDKGREVSYHNIDSVTNFSNYQDGNTLYESENGLVSFDVYEADTPKELEDIDTSSSVVDITYESPEFVEKLADKQ